MKKLLSFLGTIAIISSTSGVAISCGNNSTRITTPTLDVNKAKKIIAKLGGEFSLSYGDIFSDIDLTTAIVNEINELVSLNYNWSQTNSLLSSMGFTNYDKDNAFKTRFNNLLQTVAENKLFNEYSSTVADGDTQPLDHSLTKQLYALNPLQTTQIKTFTKDSSQAAETKYVAANAKIKFGTNNTWEIYGETTGASESVPTISDLTQEYQGQDSAFKVEAYASPEDAESGTNPTDVAISAATALSLRFQDYFNSKVMVDVMTNALTMVYNQASMWRAQDSNPYIDITNPVFSKTQTWSQTDMAQTNVKMVWTYTVKSDQKDKLFSDADGSLFKGVISKTGQLQDGKTVKDIFNTINAVTDSTNGDKKDGFDPYFGLSGYKGIVISKDGTAIGTNPISGAAYESKVNDSKNLQNKGGIIIQNAGNYAWTNADNSQDYDIVITLPIYMIQLLGVDYDSNGSTDAATNPDIKNVYSIDGAKDGESKRVQFRRSSSAPSYADAWNTYSKDTLSSKDIDTIVKNKEKQKSLLQEIEYAISQDSTNQENAKKVVYSKYLDADQIYYAGLYNQIGQYIETSKDEDE